MSCLRLFFSVVLMLGALCSSASDVVINLRDYGVRPDTKKDMSGKMADALSKINEKYGHCDSLTLMLEPGRYDFYPQRATLRPYFISNHDQDSAKRVAINLDGWTGTTFNGNGADIICHGVMLPIALVNSNNCSLRNFSIDFSNPHISQVEIVESAQDGITFRPGKEVKYRIKDSRFQSYGTGWTRNPDYGMAFDKDTHHIIYNTSDVWCPMDSLVSMPDNMLKSPKWVNNKLKAGTIVALRNWQRPAPALFLSKDTTTMVENVTVHYAEGMGLLAQLCTDITLDRFSVAIRANSGRYFTTQADATHFSGCKGTIKSVNGLYEAMMDDAINVHGTYLKVVDAKSPNIIRGRYMHDQSFGFDWGYPGDSVVIVNSSTMDYLSDTLCIKNINKLNSKEFEITFTSPLPSGIDSGNDFGIENITWTPEVLFANNIIRNNRARGSLFSTPKKVVVENNIYDHTSGAAILLSGDCNGWYETGACRDVTIRNNRFINALTCLFQFTEAVISIYPVIPNVKKQTSYFHGGEKGIRIENNVFETFDNPLLYALSVDGLFFRNNVVRHNNDFAAFHNNKFAIKLERVRNAIIAGNRSDTDDMDIKVD